MMIGIKRGVKFIGRLEGMLKSISVSRVSESICDQVIISFFRNVIFQPFPFAGGLTTRALSPRCLQHQIDSICTPDPPRFCIVSCILWPSGKLLYRNSICSRLTTTVRHGYGRTRSSV